MTSTNPVFWSEGQGVVGSNPASPAGPDAQSHLLTQKRAAGILVRNSVDSGSA
jgi:hypothetical protein